MKPPTPEELDTIAHKIAKRVSRYLEQTGYLYRDAESEYLDLVHDEDDALHRIIGASITYRLAFGSNAGKKALTLQAVPVNSDRKKASEWVSKQSDGGPQAFHCMREWRVNPIRLRNSSVRAAFRCAVT